ncbi:hypothetical protein DFH09DRAFT_1364446 [Mycena vulgaris]|nr:hypothetical protein DFH09DRAFT_1364446 [Mycena vulgaris]
MLGRLKKIPTMALPTPQPRLPAKLRGIFPALYHRNLVEALIPGCFLPVANIVGQARAHSVTYYQHTPVGGGALLIMHLRHPVSPSTPISVMLEGFRDRAPSSYNDFITISTTESDRKLIGKPYVVCRTLTFRDPETASNFSDVLALPEHLVGRRAMPTAVTGGSNFYASVVYSVAEIFDGTKENTANYRMLPGVRGSIDDEAKAVVYAFPDAKAKFQDKFILVRVLFGL